MSQALPRFLKRMMANRKQFGFMVALAIVALLMWGRLLLKDVPRTAVADPEPGRQAAAAPDAGAAQAIARRPIVSVEISDPAPRNLFNLKSDEFAKVERPNVIPAPNPVPEKSDEARRAELSAKLKDLKLKSTIMGERPAALMNDRLFHEGTEPVPGFTITRITQHSVFLKRAEFEGEFEIRMYKN
jgi:hypothetical protein